LKPKQRKRKIQTRLTDFPVIQTLVASYAFRTHFAVEALPADAPVLQAGEGGSIPHPSLL
jgi:hypothetical protein